MAASEERAGVSSLSPGGRMDRTTLLNAGIVQWFNDRWKPEMGAIDGHDLCFIDSLLAEAPPRVLVEIGCASGLSTALLAMMVDQIGPASLTSFDLGKKFYVDPTKPVGYLLSEAPALSNVKTEVVTGRACLAVPERFSPQSVDFCFIDASHRHPWPLIDTLVMLPFLKAGSYMVHHDPQMATNPKMHETGPKVVELLLPADVAVFPRERLADRPAFALKTRKIQDNIFALRRPVDLRGLASRLAPGFLLGWDIPWLNQPIGAKFAERLRRFLDTNYPPDVGRFFDIGLARYNPPDRS